MAPRSLKILSLALLCCSSATVGLCQDGARGDAALRAAVEQAVAKVKPALVRIHVVAIDFSDGREIKYEATGSGAIITPQGHVITNHHVAGDATRLFCTLSSREKIDAELVGTDPMTDIAIIKLLPEDNRQFPVVEFGDSSTIEVGDNVLALGSPYALSQSVTLGIVSNSEMIMPARRFGRLEQDGEDVGALVRWIAHDAVIFPGNSGGPLVDLDGRIIGINEIGVGLGGAIPGNLAKAVADELMATGDVKRSWIGVGIRPLLKQHRELDRGVLITDVIEGSPADKAGIESGDLLVAIAGQNVHIRFEEEIPDFNNLVAKLPVGAEVECKVIRGSTEMTLKLTTAMREKVRPQQHEIRQWGITVRDISFMMAKELKRDSRDGVVVTTVRPGGPAGEAKPGISRNDIIVAVNGEPVKSVADLVAITSKITEGAADPVPVLTTFERKTGSFVTVVKVGIKELNDPGLEVKKAWLPIESQVVTRDIAEQLGDKDLRGFRVTQVYAGSTAEKAGLKVGDLITAVDGVQLTASAPEHYEELPALIRNYRVGSVAELAVRRDGQPIEVPVELVRAPMVQREMKQYRDDNFEFTVRDITFFDKANERWAEEQNGVLVEEVKSGGWAALGDLRAGDLVVEVSERGVTDVTDFEKLMDAIEQEKPSILVFKVRRGIYTMFLEMEPKWDE